MRDQTDDAQDQRNGDEPRDAADPTGEPQGQAPSSGASGKPGTDAGERVAPEGGVSAGDGAKEPEREAEEREPEVPRPPSDVEDVSPVAEAARDVSDRSTRLDEALMRFKELMMDREWVQAIGLGTEILSDPGFLKEEYLGKALQGVELLDGAPEIPIPKRVPRPDFPKGTGLELYQRVVCLVIAAHLLDEGKPILERYQDLHRWLDQAHERLNPLYYRMAGRFIVGWKRRCYARIPFELQEYRVDKDEVLTRVGDKLTAFQRFFRFLWARFHVLVRCNFCPPQDRRSHDILGEGDCWFRRRWEEGRIDVPIWMGWQEHVRLGRIALAKKRHRLPVLEPPPPPPPPPVKRKAANEAVEPPSGSLPELRLWTIPNVLTLARVMFIPFIVLGIKLDSGMGYFMALVFASLGEVTDFTDGHIARVRGETSALGKLLDPMADTLTRFSIFVTMLSNQLFPVWMVLVLFMRDMSIAYMRAFAASNGIIISARRSGKIKAIFQGTLTLVILWVMMVARYHEEGGAALPAGGWWLALLLGLAAPQIYTWLFKIRGPLLWLIRVASVSVATLLVLARYEVLPRFDPEPVIWWSMLVVTLVTAYSLVDYLLGFVAVVRRRAGQGG